MYLWVTLNRTQLTNLQFKAGCNNYKAKFKYTIQVKVINAQHGTVDRHFNVGRTQMRGSKSNIQWTCLSWTSNLNCYDFKRWNVYLGHHILGCVRKAIESKASIKLKPTAGRSRETAGEKGRIGKMPPGRAPTIRPSSSCSIANVVVIRRDAIIIDSGAILLLEKVGGGGGGGWRVLL